MSHVNRFPLLVAVLGSLLFLVSTYLVTSPLQVAEAAGTCDYYNSGKAIPENYGASYNVFSTSEMMISVYCNDDNTIKVTAGNGDPNTYVHHRGFQYVNGAWQEFNYTCPDMVEGAWCPGEVTKTLTNNDSYSYVVSFTCQWNGSDWDCGCRDTNCATSYWQLQGWQKVVSGNTSGDLGNTSGAGEVCGAVIKSYDYEDGYIPGASSYSAVDAEYPPQIITGTNGNHFLRVIATNNDITGTGGASNIRKRVQLGVGSSPAREGDVYTYSLYMRMGSDGPQSSVMMQLFQYAEGQTPYGTENDGNGPSVWLHKNSDGSLDVRNYHDNNGVENLIDKNIGKFTSGKFERYDITVYWSNDPTKGKIEIWRDGNLVGRMTGRSTILSPLSRESAAMQIGLYGDYADGVVDFDNIEIRKGAVSSGGCN